MKFFEKAIVQVKSACLPLLLHAIDCLCLYRHKQLLLCLFRPFDYVSEFGIAASQTKIMRPGSRLSSTSK